MALYDFISMESCKGLLKVMRDNKWGLINATDYTEVVEPIWDKEPKFAYGNIIVNKEGKFGTLDENGEEIIPFKYKEISSTGHENRLWVWDFEDTVGIFDCEGNVLIPCKYTFLEMYSDDRIVVVYDGKTGMIDINGNILMPFEYSYILTNSEHRVFEYKTTEGMRGVLNWGLEQIVPAEYDTIYLYPEHITGVCGNKTALYVPGNKHTIYNYNGEKLIDSIECRRLKPVCKDCFIITNDNCFVGIIKSDGSFIAEPIYEQIKYLGEGLFGVCKQMVEGSVSPKTKKTGLIDLEGNEVLPFKYTFIEEFNNGMAKVGLGNKFGIVNSKGKTIIPFKYTDLKYTSDSRYFAAMKDKKWGIITSKGKAVTPFIYNEVFDVKKNGFATVKYNQMDGEVIL